MKKSILILLWSSSIFFFTLYARDSDAADVAVQAQAGIGFLATISNLNSERCIGVDRASTSSGAYIKQFKCDYGADNQKWQLNPVGGGGYTFRNKKSSTMCMGVDRASIYPNADIRQFPCDSSSNQIWVLFPPTPTSTKILINAKSMLCLGVNQASKAIGAQLKQFVCDLPLDPAVRGAPNQSWIIVRYK